MSRLPLAAVPALALFALAGCGESADATSIYVVPSSLSELSDDKFFDHPWPSDLRMENGFIRVTGYPNPRANAVINEYIESTEGLFDGFSPAAAGYVRFTGPIDPTSLPADPVAAMQDGASVVLLDIDPVSPERGQKKLVTLQWREQSGVYYQPNTLAFMPSIGYPLRPKTRYALVVTNAVKSKGGSPIGPSDDLRKVLGLDQAEGATRTAHDALATAVAEIENKGIPRDTIAHLAVFTTNDPTGELYAVADDVHANVEVPDVGQWKLETTNSLLDQYTGLYGPSPNYQAGQIPFEAYGDGGAFNFEGGHPAVVDQFYLRYSMVVPNRTKCPMPVAGYPIVLYAHGTGGDFESYLNDGTAYEAVKRCFAMMGVDQIFHGTRPGAPPDGDEGKIQLLFFNFQNPIAARTNGRQSAIDEVQRARLFTERKITVPSTVTPDQVEVRFDPSKVMYFGHSQGGLNGPLYLAADDSARGGVLSGSGALLIIALLEKTEPQPSVAGLVKTIFLQLKPEEEEELDELHPTLSLAQTIVDAVDPIHYARNIIREPRMGFASKSIYMTEGINPDGVGDSYAPPHGIEAHGVALGLPLMEPFQRAIVEAAWGGLGTVVIPAEGLTGNLANGNASGVIAQWAVPPDSDGHFVVFDVKAAKFQAANFLRNLADDPKGRVPPP